MNESRHLFRSAALGNERAVWIRDPEDGEPGDLAVFLDAEIYREKIHAPALLGELETRGEIAPTRAVFVSSAGVEERWRECPCHPPFARFLADELLPWLEATAPFARPPRARVLVGLSYTGLAAAYVALAAPGRFSKVVAQSGSFWWNDSWLERHVGRFASPSAAETGFWLGVGKRETQAGLRHRPDVFQAVSQIECVHRFHAALRRRGLRSRVREGEGGHHFTAWREDLPDALRWALPALAPAS